MVIFFIQVLFYNVVVNVNDVGISGILYVSEVVGCEFFSKVGPSSNALYAIKNDSEGFNARIVGNHFHDLGGGGVILAGHLGVVSDNVFNSITGIGIRIESQSANYGL